MATKGVTLKGQIATPAWFCCGLNLAAGNRVRWPKRDKKQLRVYSGDAS